MLRQKDSHNNNSDMFAGIGKSFSSSLDDKGDMAILAEEDIIKDLDFERTSQAKSADDFFGEDLASKSAQEIEEIQFRQREKERKKQEAKNLEMKNAPSWFTTSASSRKKALEEIENAATGKGKGKGGGVFAKAKASAKSKAQPKMFSTRTAGLGLRGTSMSMGGGLFAEYGGVGHITQAFFGHDATKSLLGETIGENEGDASYQAYKDMRREAGVLRYEGGIVKYLKNFAETNFKLREKIVRKAESRRLKESQARIRGLDNLSHGEDYGSQLDADIAAYEAYERGDIDGALDKGGEKGEYRGEGGLDGYAGSGIAKEDDMSYEELIAEAERKNADYRAKQQKLRTKLTAEKEKARQQKIAAGELNADGSELSKLQRKGKGKGGVLPKDERDPKLVAKELAKAKKKELDDIEKEVLRQYPEDNLVKASMLKTKASSLQDYIVAQGGEAEKKPEDDENKNDQAEDSKADPKAKSKGKGKGKGKAKAKTNKGEHPPPDKKPKGMHVPTEGDGTPRLHKKGGKPPSGLKKTNPDMERKAKDTVEKHKVGPDRPPQKRSDKLKFYSEPDNGTDSSEDSDSSNDGQSESGYGSEGSIIRNGHSYNKTLTRRNLDGSPNAAWGRKGRKTKTQRRFAFYFTATQTQEKQLKSILKKPREAPFVYDGEDPAPGTDETSAKYDADNPDQAMPEMEQRNYNQWTGGGSGPSGLDEKASLMNSKQDKSNIEGGMHIPECRLLHHMRDMTAYYWAQDHHEHPATSDFVNRQIKKKIGLSFGLVPPPPGTEKGAVVSSISGPLYKEHEESPEVAATIELYNLLRKNEQAKRECLRENGRDLVFSGCAEQVISFLEKSDRNVRFYKSKMELLRAPEVVLTWRDQLRCTLEKVVKSVNHVYKALARDDVIEKRDKSLILQNPTASGKMDPSATYDAADKAQFLFLKKYSSRGTKYRAKVHEEHLHLARHLGDLSDICEVIGNQLLLVAEFWLYHSRERGDLVEEIIVLNYRLKRQYSCPLWLKNARDVQKIITSVEDLDALRLTAFNRRKTVKKEIVRHTQNALQSYTHIVNTAKALDHFMESKIEIIRTEISKFTLWDPSKMSTFDKACTKWRLDILSEFTCFKRGFDHLMYELRRWERHCHPHKSAMGLEGGISHSPKEGSEKQGLAHAEGCVKHPHHECWSDSSDDSVRMVKTLVATLVANKKNGEDPLPPHILDKLVHTLEADSDGAGSQISLESAEPEAKAIRLEVHYGGDADGHTGPAKARRYNLLPSEEAARSANITGTNGEPGHANPNSAGHDGDKTHTIADIDEIGMIGVSQPFPCHQCQLFYYSQIPFKKRYTQFRRVNQRLFQVRFHNSETDAIDEFLAEEEKDLLKDIEERTAAGTRLTKKGVTDGNSEEQIKMANAVRTAYGLKGRYSGEGEPMYFQPGGRGEREIHPHHKKFAKGKCLLLVSLYV